MATASTRIGTTSPTRSHNETEDVMRLTASRVCLFVAIVALSTVSAASGVMVPMEQIGPQSRPVLGYTNIVRVSSGGDFKTVGAALESIKDASPTKRYAVLVAAGTYNETPLRMKAHVDLYGGFPADGG